MRKRHYLLTAGLICTSVLLNMTTAQADQSGDVSDNQIIHELIKPATSQDANTQSAALQTRPVASQTSNETHSESATAQSQGTIATTSQAASATSTVASQVPASVVSATNQSATTSVTSQSAATSVIATVQSVQSQASQATSAVSQSATTSQSQAVSQSNAMSQVASAAASQGVTSQTAVNSQATTSTKKVVPSKQVGPGNYDLSIANGVQRYSNNTDFLNNIKPGAIDGWHQYQVLPSITAAQAILESGWGTSQLSTLGNNLFGIKGDYNGNSVTYPTREFINGQSVVVNAAFRQYPSQSASLTDHGAFLNVNSRYQNLLNQRDYHLVAQLLQQDGYATDPHYAELLILLIEQNNLASWDQLAFSGQTLPVTDPQPEVPNDAQFRPVVGHHTFDTSTNIYNQPNTDSPTIGQYAKGEAVNYIAEQTIDGTRWLKYVAFSGQAHYVPVKLHTQPVPKPMPTVQPAQGEYRFTRKTTIHAQPTEKSASLGHYAAGETVYYNGRVAIDGQTWLRYQAYSGRQHYALMANQAAAPVIEAATGSHQFDARTDIRTSPDWQAPVVGQYWSGETVYYNGQVTINGTTWLRYLARSGQLHYVPVNKNNSAPTEKSESGVHRFAAWTAIRTAPNSSAPVVGYYGAGETVYYVGQVQVNGQLWLKYLGNSGAYHYVAVGSAQATNVTAERGSFRFTTTTNIRLAPSLGGTIVGEYYSGEVVYYVGKVQADGYTWLKYLARDGRYHYVAIVH